MSTKKSSNMIMTIFFILTIIALSSCSFFRPSASKNNINFLIAPYENKLGDSGQILLVVENSNIFFTKRIVYALEKRSGIWQMAFEPFYAVVGKNGFAPPGEKREGDGKTPSGIFALRQTFGYAPSAITKMPYRQALEDDLWIDDANADDYNRWVKANETSAKSYEKMKREDDLYKYGIVIEYNTNSVIKGYGSAIFFHVWRRESVPTAGCVAVSEENIIKIITWLDSKSLPLIIMGIKN
jgi:L,D-peptidoglycan transpeptidase YkuD (ErfK/YbiS/YcfS/YnhG family)